MLKRCCSITMKGSEIHGLFEQLKDKIHRNEKPYSRWDEHWGPLGPETTDEESLYSPISVDEEPEAMEGDDPEILKFDLDEGMEETEEAEK